MASEHLGEREVECLGGWINAPDSQISRRSLSGWKHEEDVQCICDSYGGYPNRAKVHRESTGGLALL